METCTKYNEAVPASGRILTALTVAILTVMPAGCAPQTPSPAAWIEMDSGGGRNVYYLAKDGKPVQAGRLTGPVPSQGPGQGTTYTMMPQQQMMNCIVTPVGLFC